jgi:hypothetical protein
MATDTDFVVKITCDFDIDSFDLAINKFKEFREASKISLWQLIKMKILKVFLPRPKITIEELINKERGI